MILSLLVPKRKRKGRPPEPVSGWWYFILMFWVVCLFTGCGSVSLVLQWQDEDPVVPEWSPLPATQTPSPVIIYPATQAPFVMPITNPDYLGEVMAIRDPSSRIRVCDDARCPVTQELAFGSKLWIISVNGEWYYVEFPGLVIGYMHQSEVSVAWFPKGE